MWFEWVLQSFVVLNDVEWEYPGIQPALYLYCVSLEYFGIYWDYNLVMWCSLPRDWTREDGNTFFFLKERDVVCNLAIEVWNTAHLVRCYQNVDIFSFNKQKAVRLRGVTWNFLDLLPIMTGESANDGNWWEMWVILGSSSSVRFSSLVRALGTDGPWELDAWSNLNRRAHGSWLLANHTLTDSDRFWYVCRQCGQK